jgi:hypothetical protein
LGEGPGPSQIAGLGELLGGPGCSLDVVGTDGSSEVPLGRYMMSRLAGFYIAKAIESVAGRPPAAAASDVLPRRAGANPALGVIRAHDRNPAILQQVVAAVRHIIGGLRRVGRERQRLDHLRVRPREPAQQP